MVEDLSIGVERLPVQFVGMSSPVRRSPVFRGRCVLVVTECWMGKMGEIGDMKLFDVRAAVLQRVLCRYSYFFDAIGVSYMRLRLVCLCQFESKGAVVILFRVRVVDSTRVYGCVSWSVVVVLLLRISNVGAV